MKKMVVCCLALFVSSFLARAQHSTDWLSGIPDGQVKRQVVMSCTPCHQIGTPVTTYKTEKDWLEVMAKMKGIDRQYGTELILDDFRTADAAKLLASNLNSRVVDDFSEVASMHEYPFGPGDGFYHDMEFAGGKAWAVDFFGNVLYSVDPDSGQVHQYKIPLRPMAGGHTINRDDNGRIWITFLNACQVAVFDPKAEQFKFYGGFEPDSHVHSFAIDTDGRIYHDRKGRVWITHFTRNYLSRLDPATGEIERFYLPPSASVRTEQIHPYGVVVDSRGILWYTKLGDNLIGRLNPKTGQAKEFRMPEQFSGPRRLAIDNNGNLWIPEYTTNKVSVFSTKRLEFTHRYTLPAAGDYPYAARKNPVTGEIWVCGTGSDSLYKFKRKTDRFVRYKLPSLAAYTRAISFAPNGDVWACYASFPNTQGPYKTGVMVRLRLK